jgi:2-dehydropantoate 2-reductase
MRRRAQSHPMANFIILGAGAIGCYVGGRLAAAGQNVTLVGRPRTIEPLVLTGLTVTDLEGFKAHVPASRLNLAIQLSPFVPSNTVLTPASTVILLCVKGGATASAAREIAASGWAGATVISLQNGVDNVTRIQATVPTLHALAGMVPYNVVMKDDAHVHRATMGHLHIAHSPITAELAPLFDTAGLPTTWVNDMRAVQWGKLLLNLNNPINALSDLPLREQLLNRDFRTVLAALQTEALAALRSAGITPAKVASAPPKLLPHLLRLPNLLFIPLAAKMLRMDASARSSMWDDVQRGRTTEIDDLCGAVVRLAAQVGVSAPCNTAMCQLMAMHHQGQRWTGATLREALNI